MSTPLPLLDTLQRVELASGVAIELHPAGPVVRARAWLLDLAWMSLAYALAGALIALSTSAIGWEGGSGLFLLLSFFMTWGYRVLYEVHRGATPGKKSCGLKVVMSSGAPLTWTAAILRNLLRAVDFLPAAYLTGLASTLMNQRFQRLGDLVADTLVVYCQPPSPLAPSHLPSEAFPPPLPLSRAERAALIQFNERLPTWSEARRAELAAPLEPLSGARGAAGVRRLAAIGCWLRDS